MTIDELRKQLDDFNLPGDTPVVLARDAEGNGDFSPACEAEVAMYDAESTWAGQRYMTEEDRQATGGSRTSTTRPPGRPSAPCSSGRRTNRPSSPLPAVIITGKD